MLENVKTSYFKKALHFSKYNIASCKRLLQGNRSHRGLKKQARAAREFLSHRCKDLLEIVPRQLSPCIVSTKKSSEQAVCMHYVIKSAQYTAYCGGKILLLSDFCREM
jgi:hypothetical protein